MQRVLITGMSGVGKSTVAERLSELGYKAIDFDDEGFSPVDERGDQHWDIDRVRQLLATEDADVLFVIGADDAQVLFYPEFDHIVLLSAPREVMLERLATRTNNPFGKNNGDLAKILADLEAYEPMIRRSATLEIDTSQPLDRVVEGDRSTDPTVGGSGTRVAGRVLADRRAPVPAEAFVSHHRESHLGDEALHPHGRARVREDRHPRSAQG